jgi:hypothetical protein
MRAVAQGGGLARSPFLLIWHHTKDELNAIDEFVDLARKARESQQERLERLAAATRRAAPHDDWLVDDFALLGEFAALSVEFAIIGLWRCVEFYRQRAHCCEDIPVQVQGISERAFEIGDSGATNSLRPIRGRAAVS